MLASPRLRQSPGEVRCGGSPSNRNLPILPVARFPETPEYLKGRPRHQSISDSTPTERAATAALSKEPESANPSGSPGRRNTPLNHSEIPLPSRREGLPEGEASSAGRPRSQSIEGYGPGHTQLDQPPARNLRQPRTILGPPAKTAPTAVSMQLEPASRQRRLHPHDHGIGWLQRIHR